MDLLSTWQSVKSTVASVTEEIKLEVKQQAALLNHDQIGIHYITKRILAMGLPYDETTKNAAGVTVAQPVPAAAAAGGVSVRQLKAFLQQSHPEKYMIYNLSEKAYDYAQFENQVIEFRFPGYPSPPLSQIFAVCNSISTWLSADEANVAIIHCQTGRGRTLCAIAWYLAWSGQIPSVQQAVAHVARRLGLQAEQALIPTQQRYLDYLAAMLAGKRPSTTPMTLERVIMNGIPRLGDRRPGAVAPDGTLTSESLACRPYLQIFSNSKLLYTSTGLDSTELRWYTSKDSCVLFPVNLVLEGDILIRIRHLSGDEPPKRISMLRFGFHTGFITPGNTRFTKAQLDGAASDDRFAQDFWLDLIFRTADPKDHEHDEEMQAKQREYWDQVNKARRQTTPARAGAELQPPTAKVALPSASPPAAAATSAAASTAVASSTSTSPSAATASSVAPKASPSSATSSAPATHPSVADSAATAAATAAAAAATAKKQLGSLFSSASSGLKGLGLWGSGAAADDSSSVVPAKDDPELARLRAADAEMLRKAKRKAATEAAVSAALAVSPSPTPVKVPAARTQNDADSFADLQAYVSGLHSADAQVHSADSDDEEELPTRSPPSALVATPKQLKHATSIAAPAAAGTPASSEEADLAQLMAQHLGDDATTSTATTKPFTSTAATAPALDLLSAAPAPAAAGAVLTTGDVPIDASLEAELSALDFDTAAAGDDGELVLNDDDEQALLASLQDELDE